jgi:transglutaminase-like putative cysteine protease
MYLLSAMNEADILREAEEIDMELRANPDKLKEKQKSPLVYILAVFFALLIILMVVPYYSIRANPEPSRQILLNDVIPAGLNIPPANHTPDYKSDYYLLVTPTNPTVKDIATQIATYGCGSNAICQAKAEFYFVRNSFAYVSETDDYLQSPQEMLLTRGGDCDDHAIMLANLMQAIGIPTKFVFVPGHVYVDIYLEDVPRKYKNDYGWVSVDATCKSCDFGEIPQKYADVEKMYI